MAKRIICRKCKKRRLPWFHFYGGTKVTGFYIIHYMGIEVNVSPHHVCKGCVDGVLRKVEEALKEAK